MLWKSNDFLRDFLQNWRFEVQKRNFSARLPSKLKFWSSKTKLFCETSFKHEALKIKSKAFLRDFPSKAWKIKNEAFLRDFPLKAWKIKNEAFLRDFLQNWSFEAQKRSFSLWRSKTKLFCETSFKNHMLTGHLTSEFQYVLIILKWMLQKYCACHAKVEPRHTKSCNCHAKWSLQINTSVTWNLQPFHRFCVGGFKHWHRKARNHRACHAKCIVSEPLQIPHACRRFATLTNSCACHAFWNVSKSLRLPRENLFEPQKVVRDPGILTILSSKSFSRASVVQILPASTSKSRPRLSVFNDFDFQIVLARRRGANFGDFNFQKCSESVSF